MPCARIYQTTLTREDGTTESHLAAGYNSTAAAIQAMNFCYGLTTMKARTAALKQGRMTSTETQPWMLYDYAVDVAPQWAFETDFAGAVAAASEHFGESGTARPCDPLHVLVTLEDTTLKSLADMLWMRRSGKGNRGKTTINTLGRVIPWLTQSSRKSRSRLNPNRRLHLAYAIRLAMELTWFADPRNIPYTKNKTVLDPLENPDGGAAERRFVRNKFIETHKDNIGISYAEQFIDRMGVFFGAIDAEQYATLKAFLAAYGRTLENTPWSAIMTLWYDGYAVFDKYMKDGVKTGLYYNDHVRTAIRAGRLRKRDFHIPREKSEV